ncbi:MAG TPA: winged helix-turn-helix domain-containing protein [Candidatus Bilamarchaeum sp.]|nr:winged helix-turn-helix domain-containing protein [Candidatus Bilamarchaeum sp.]
MDDEKIVLDRKSFEALAVDSRVKILKSLKQRRKTLSELAKEQGMSVSGVKEHLETLEKVGLIEKMDDGHKWKYYELTKKGQDIVAPKELRVWILLSISTIALVASMFAILSAPEAAGALPPEAPQMLAAEADSGVIAGSEPAEGNDSFAFKAMAAPMPEEAPAPEEPPAPDLTVPTAVAVISGLTLVACIGILARNRMKPASL